MMSWSLVLLVLVWRGEEWAGLELSAGVTEGKVAAAAGAAAVGRSKTLFANFGVSGWICSSPSSKLFSRESMVDSKNWRHSCSS